MAAYQPLKGKSPVGIDKLQQDDQGKSGPLSLALLLLTLPALEFSVAELQRKQRSGKTPVDQADIDALLRSVAALQAVRAELTKNADGRTDRHDQAISRALVLLDQTVRKFPDAAHPQWADLAAVATTLKK